MRLIFLHHAGGDKYAWRNYKGQFSQKIEQVYLELPGRGDRFGETLLTDIYAMVDDIYHSIQIYLNQPYVLVGNSMGALNAFLLTQKLQQQQQRLPLHLFLGSRPSPTVQLDFKKIAEEDSDGFWEGVKTYGGVPEALLQHKDLMNFYEPILRADFKALESFELKSTQTVDVPATIMIGKEDRFSLSEIKHWQSLFNKNIEFSEEEGGHFFMYDHVALIANMIEKAIERSKKPSETIEIFGFN